MNAYLEMIEIRPQSDLASKARLALERAMVLDGKVSQDILALEGMSGKKYRYFVNNLIESMEDLCYLEIGVWAGSTPTLDGLQPPVDRNSGDWHNGYLIAVLCKSSA
jgi:hypothetical protein